MAGRDDRSKKIKKKRKQEKKIRNREGEAAAAGRGRKRETGEHRGTKWESWIRKGRQSFGVTRALMAFRASLMSSGATRRRHTPMAFIWPFLTVFVIIILHYNTKRNIKKGKRQHETHEINWQRDKRSSGRRRREMWIFLPCWKKNEPTRSMINRAREGGSCMLNNEYTLGGLSGCLKSMITGRTRARTHNVAESRVVQVGRQKESRVTETSKELVFFFFFCFCGERYHRGQREPMVKGTFV